MGVAILFEWNSNLKGVYSSIIMTNPTTRSNNEPAKFHILNANLKNIRYLDLHMYYIILPLISLEFLSLHDLLTITLPIYFIGLGLSVLFSGRVLTVTAP